MKISPRDVGPELRGLLHAWNMGYDDPHLHDPTLPWAILTVAQNWLTFVDSKFHPIMISTGIIAW